jgi:hypothetical protein
MGGVPGARSALAVVINIASSGVRPINMDTGQVKRRFYHLATIKHAGTYDADGFIVVRSAYQQYGDKSEAIWTGPRRSCRLPGRLRHRVPVAGGRRRPRLRVPEP